MAAALSLCLALSGQQSVSVRVRTWIYKKLGIDPSIVQKFTSPKGGGERRLGARLMSVDLRDEQEHLVWACGVCWAPAIANSDDIAILKADGIWITASPEPPKLVVRASGLLDILGRTASDHSRLLVARKVQGDHEPCTIRLQIADLKSGTLEPVSDSDPNTDSDCIGTTVGLVHRDELFGAQKLSSSTRDGPLGPALQLLVQKATTNGSSGLTPLTPRLNERDSTEDRFDPIWRTQFEVVYLSRSE